MLWEASAWDNYQANQRYQIMFPSHQKRRLGLQSPTYLLLDWRKVPAASFRLEESLEKVELLSLSMKFKGMSQSSLFSVPVMYVIGAVNISWRVLKCQRLFICYEKQVFQNKKKNVSLLLISIPQCFLSRQTLMLMRLMSIRLPVLLPVKLTSPIIVLPKYFLGLTDHLPHPLPPEGHADTVPSAEGWASVPCVACGTLLQLDPTGLVVTPVTPGASLGQLPQSRQAFRELVLARVSVTIARSRLWLQPHDS